MQWENSLGMLHAVADWYYITVLLRISNRDSVTYLELLSESAGWVGVHSLPQSATSIKECQDYTKFLGTLQASQ